ncbi:ATP-binding cassette domain-containing protein [Kitasatospora sp. CMC57]|uniref:ATP-binding cassette domain-containing protein n=1 Tax=Kitasatospora sp. CMC57 TaxID=3231513 RepID=UPI0038B66EE8
MRLEAVGKAYPGGPPVLVDADLELPPGEVVSVAGGNGSGKSTLLRIMAGLSRPSTGTVSGRPGVVGWVPDRFPPHERLSALAYLRHLGRIRGLSRRAATTRAAELLDRLALVGGSGTAVRELSKGNAQKVAVAQALLVPPELLVLDEPWSGLDAAAQGTLVTLIGEVAAAGGAVVFTDHREALSRSAASRAYRISAGRVLPVGSEIPVHEVELAAGDRPEPVDWRALDGVREVTGPNDRLILRVAAPDSDTLLLTALRHGWTIRGLRRLGGGGPR